ncbi:MAG: hypothetical protein IPP42_22830 [Saprospiraceae bacterium]|nr:hypothetical protein [Saprospiraceae bacterium]
MLSEEEYQAQKEKLLSRI